MGDVLADALRFEKYFTALQEILAIKAYERDDTSLKVSYLVNVYEIEKSWFDEDQKGSP